MDESKRKPIYIAVIVVCLGLAGIITWKGSSGGGGTLDDIPDSEKLWVKCNNPGCGEAYQIDKKDYFLQIEERRRAHPMLLQTPGLICEKCGKESVFEAEKCEKCGRIFFSGSVQPHFVHLCPDCGYGAIVGIPGTAQSVPRK